MRAVDLFAGAGGLSEGLRVAGFDVVGAYEANAHACATHAAAHPETAVHCGALTGHETLPSDIDLLVGGPPCQPFSGAGLKLGEHDPRDGYPIVLRLLETHQPRAVLLENVKGILAARSRPYFGRVLAALRERGYRVDFRCLQAADYGVPQRRERVFIVALRDDEDFARWRWPAPTHSLHALVAAKYLHGGFDESTATRYETAAIRLLRRKAPRSGSRARLTWEAAQAGLGRLPWVTVRHALGDLVHEYLPGRTLHTPPIAGHIDAQLIDEGAGGHYEGGSRAKSLLYKQMRPDVPSPTISAAAEQKGSEHCSRIALRVKNGRYRTSLVGQAEVMPTVPASYAKDRPRVVVRNLGAGDGLGARVDDVAPTVPATRGGQVGLAVYDADSVREWVGSEGTTEPGRVHRRPETVLRRLSIAEVAALQTFPADYPWQGPVTAQYRQIGNAVPPRLAEHLGHALMRALEGTD